MSVSSDGAKPAREQTPWGRVIIKAWSDPEFKARLIADPRGVLEAEGVKVPAAATIKVLENTETLTHLILPPTPAAALSDDQLDKVAGGLTFSTTNLTTSSVTPKFHLGASSCGSGEPKCHNLPSF